MRSTQVLIIGAGPGGYVAAIRLGRLGKKVLLVEKRKLGGECLNYGCIPSKALISAAGVLHKAKKAKDWGLEFDGLHVDPAKLQAWKNSLVANLNKGVAGLLKGNGVAVIEGEASFLGPKQARARTQQGLEEISFEQAIIATGSSPMEIPGFSIDGQWVIGSQEALDLAEIPKSLVVIGGGVIGLEIGTFFAKLGGQVIIVELMSQLLPGIDAEFVALVSRSLEKLGVKVYVNSQALGYERRDNGVAVKIKTAQGELEIPADKILLSIGRKPNSGGLDLGAAGIKADAKGFVSVDRLCRTSAEGIFAIGDVTAGPLLAHRSSAQALAVAQEIATGRQHAIGAIPAAVFTDPEVAVVGISERQAKEQGWDVVTGKFPVAALGRALAAGEPEGFAKIVADRATKKILGAGIVAAHASDLISEMALAMRLGATLDDVAATVHPHPTLPEIWMEAAEAGLGLPVHVLPPQRVSAIAR